MDFLAGALAAVAVICVVTGFKKVSKSIDTLGSQVDDLQVALSDIAGKDDE